MRIVSLSNDEDLSKRLKALLDEQGFQVEAVQWIPADASLVILDERVSPEGGFEVLRKIRVSSHVPVIMLLDTAEADRRIGSLEAGADDCVGLPFHPREFMARVRSVLRRRGPEPQVIEANGVRIDTASREVFCDGFPVGTTTVEFEVLEVLLRSAGEPVSRDQLMGALYNRKATAFDRAIDMHVSHLRKKLAQDRTLIKTVRGAGYQFCLPGQE